MAYVSTTYIPAEDAPTLRTPIDPPAFRDGEEVVVVGGTMRGIVGKIVKSDSRPGTASVHYVPTWNPSGCIAYSIPEAHLIRLHS